MRSTIILTIVFGFIVMATLVSCAKEEAARQTTPAALPGQSQALEVGNKFCPVSGEKVGQMGKVETIEYNGKMYNLCCAMCKKDFNKDPEKYIKKIEQKEGLK